MPEVPQNGPAPTPIVELAEVDSTNAEAMRRASAGERGPVWISALRQTAGRGRSGRTWTSLEGNLMATLLFQPGAATRRLGELALVAGVATHEAIAELQPLAGLRLKWPNDVLLGDAKVGGILVESSTFDGATISAIGCGINVAAAPDVPGRATTALACHGGAPPRAALLQALSARMAHWLLVWHAPDGFQAIREAWLARAGALGVQATVRTGSQAFSGAFAGLDHDGALLLRDPAGNLRRFSFGDVTMAAEAATNARGVHGG